ncbi:hypothetical protein EC973_002235 [Apophysomyces ossiformis]|uniref:Fucosyltransferase n=1 Tax=Apophysomyces ossiformis TaxID=679940 RepID=A0A8H7BRB3_9FUNG|nr:hypothetical protein EC973_002235 [Apophysomyces ossiformis]
MFEGLASSLDSDEHQGEDNIIGTECPPPGGFYFANETSWCTITPNTTDLDNVAAYVFHAADYAPSTMPPRIDRQPFILETQESPLTAPFRTSTEEMKKFDYLASYHFKSQFLFPYYGPDLIDVVNRPLPENFMATKTDRAPILWIARNCQASNARQVYIEELMKHVKVDSYSYCLNNKPFPDNKTRLELMAEYKFYLAVENANCDDYVTEKLFDTFMQSAVPIVDGPQSYDGFIPTNHSVIRMDQYLDPRDLAAYINYLDSNDTAYLEYLSFRKSATNVYSRQDLEPSFVKNWGNRTLHNERSSWCSVCRGVAPLWRSRHDPSFNFVQPDPSERFLTDTSCMTSAKWDYVANGPPFIPPWLAKPEKEAPQITSEQEPNYESALVAVTADTTERSSISMMWASEAFVCMTFLAFIVWMLYRRRYLPKVRSPSPA